MLAGLLQSLLQTALCNVSMHCSHAFAAAAVDDGQVLQI